MEHRRRGADFSHLLETFCINTTDCGPALESKALESRLSAEGNVATNSSSRETYDGDKRAKSKVSTCSDKTLDCGSFKSTIVTGRTAESDSQRISGSSYRTAPTGSAVSGGIRSTNTSLDSCQQSEAQSVMDRTITLQFSRQPELDLSQTTAEPRSSGEMNRNIVSPSERSSDESRDTNYNIKHGGVQVASPSRTEEFCRGLQSPRHKFRPSTPRAPSIERRDDTFSLLASLDRVLDSPGDGAARSKQRILRRLSQEFLDSPRTFTERLVTIIDESGTGHGADDSGVNLSRMTREFRRTCKFIQDESMPEMAPSLCANSFLGFSRCPDDKRTGHERPDTIVESPTESPAPDYHCTPEIRQYDLYAKKTYRKTPLNIFRKAFRDDRAAASPGSPGSPNTTREFESLEKYCEGLPGSPASPSRIRRKPPLRRSVSSPDVAEDAREKLRQKSEELLRSLDDTTVREFEAFDSHRGREAANPATTEAPSSRTRDDLTCVANRYDENEARDSIEQYENLHDVDDGEVDEVNEVEDELSKSLMVEKELQRQRCFETALVMQEIAEDAKRTNEEFPKALERHGIDPDAAFMETMQTCLAYRNCLTGMRQSHHLGRREPSSVDSGIDTRSFGRTLHASGKKSINEASQARISQKSLSRVRTAENSPRYGGISSARSAAKSVTGATRKTGREATGQAQKLSRVVSPRSNDVFLRLVARSAAQSRSTPRAKRSPTFPAVSHRRFLKTPENHRHRVTREKSPLVPRIVVVAPATPANPAGGSCSRGSEKLVTSGGRKSPTQTTATPRRVTSISTPLRTKNSGSKRLAPSLQSSTPIGRDPSKERAPRTAGGGMEIRARSPAAAKTTRSPGKRLFVTPGRNTPAIRKRKTKTYFSMDDDIQELSRPIMKNLHAPGLYKIGYKTVVSPVSMYIRGTDVNLVQNNRERKNEMMLTPTKVAAAKEKLKFELGSRSSPLNSPRRKDRLFRSHEDSESDDNDENAEEPGFALPKANYYASAQVHTVNESPKPIHGQRTRGLLQSIQNRIVIRHEGKRLGKNEDRELPESCGDSAADTSIHVIKSAEKTNFMDCNRRKF